MDKQPDKLFVYGSLRSGFRTDAYQYLSQYFHLLGKGTVSGCLYDQGEYPVAVPTQDEPSLIGELYQLNNFSEFTWVMGQLDDYEGLNTEDGKTPLYKREITRVKLNDNSIEAWIYWYNRPVTELPRINSGDLLEYLEKKNKP